MNKPYWESLFFDDGGIHIEGDAELMRKINEARAERQKPDDSPLESRLSLMAGAVASIGEPLSVGKRMQTCATAEKDLEGYLLKPPQETEIVETENGKIPFFDPRAVEKRWKENQLYEAVRQAKFEEYARLEARTEWEAEKQAAALPSPAPVAVVKPKAKRCTWRDVSSAYIVEVTKPSTKLIHIKPHSG